MRDFSDNNIVGDVNINDSSGPGRSLDSLSNEELAEEEMFRKARLKQERTKRRRWLLTILAFAVVLALVAYAAFLVWGDWNVATVVIGSVSAAVACGDLKLNGAPNKYEMAHMEALRDVRDLYRLRGYRPPKR